MGWKCREVNFVPQLTHDKTSLRIKVHVHYYVHSHLTMVKEKYII